MEKSYLDEFTNYVKSNYNLNDSVIYEKYEHTLRVSTLMTYLALKLDMLNDDVLLAFKIGLFHDLGRFREVVRNKDKDRKLNNLTFDHGAYSVKILYNDGLINKFDINKEDDLIIKKALYYHNKKDLELNKLNERELLFSQMIRDMDKLDLLYIRSKKRKLLLKEDVNDIVLNNYFNNKTINIKDLKNDSDRVVFYLSFIKDLFFDESFDIAINSGYLEHLICLFNIDEEKRVLFEELLNKLKERKDKYVREKIRSYKC